MESSWTLSEPLPTPRQTLTTATLTWIFTFLWIFKKFLRMRKQIRHLPASLRKRHLPESHLSTFRNFQTAFESGKMFASNVFSCYELDAQCSIRVDRSYLSLPKILSRESIESNRKILVWRLALFKRHASERTRHVDTRKMQGRHRTHNIWTAKSYFLTEKEKE